MFKSNGKPIILARGENSDDAHYARPAKIVASKLDNASYAHISGHHCSFATDAELFASELKALLDKI